ncbi:MAG: hypothetical protein M3Z54_03420 [Gemmatimonadota bacterium]|nr:hypothetical protein [Gemmatimonadota bacterium]
MKRSVCWVTMLVLCAGCETSANPLDGILGGGSTLTAAQATGNWSFTVQQTLTLPCSNTPLANGTLITSHLDVLSDGSLGPTTSFWQDPIAGGSRPLSGFVLLIDGTIDLHLAAPTVRSNAQMELQGRITAAGALTGTLSDPEPGFFQVFGSGGCQYTVTGSKTG